MMYNLISGWKEILTAVLCIIAIIYPVAASQPIPEKPNDSFFLCVFHQELAFNHHFFGY